MRYGSNEILLSNERDRQCILFKIISEIQTKFE